MIRNVGGDHGSGGHESVPAYGGTADHGRIRADRRSSS